MSEKCNVTQISKKLNRGSGVLSHFQIKGPGPQNHSKFNFNMVPSYIWKCMACFGIFLHRKIDMPHLYSKTVYIKLNEIHVLDNKKRF